ncbi:MAG: hypothetical protein WAV55_08585 [Clostridiaceae bacterium]
MNIFEWLKDSDPSLRWQVERDLLKLPKTDWQETRKRTHTEGNAAILLSHHGPDGLWEQGAFLPWYVREGKPGYPWKATTTVLHDLQEWGVESSALKPDTAGLIKKNARWEYEDLPYWEGEVDACINGMTLVAGAWLQTDVSGILQWFVDHQMADGGWNCEWVNGSVVSSFVSTLNSLISLLEYEKIIGRDVSIDAMRKSAEEYLLKRQLMERLSTGERHPWVEQLGYPFRHSYSIIRALDYFRAASSYDGSKPDQRLSEAVMNLKSKRHPDGTWHADFMHEGDTWTESETPGEPSRWLTFYALRILTWWDENN